MGVIAQLGPTRVILLAASLVIGAVIGIGISLIVNLALVEISVSPFFSFYFGILFVAVGCVILWRIMSQDITDSAHLRKMHLAIFAGVIVFSGLLCFILDRRIFVGLQSWLKVPLYMCLGLTVAFALTFSVIDFLNYAIGLCQSSVAKPLVESTQQVYLVLVVSLAMGVVFGFTFGLLDVEDEKAHHIKVALLREEQYCYPMGAILGAFAGYGNEWYRQQDVYAFLNYQGVNQSEFDDDI